MIADKVSGQVAARAFAPTINRDRCHSIAPTVRHNKGQCRERYVMVSYIEVWVTAAIVQKPLLLNAACSVLPSSPS